jgi:hypothetical protein
MTWRECLRLLMNLPSTPVEPSILARRVSMLSCPLGVLEVPTGAVQAGPTTRGMRWFLLDVGVFAAILIVALARLPEPLFGDQALNMLMGQTIAEGGSPYVDVWDLKHPGVFFFFATAGALFGFKELGIHLFELLWMLSLAVLVRMVAGSYLRCRLAASLAPALTIGHYYALTTGYHLTQPRR